MVFEISLTIILYFFIYLITFGFVLNFKKNSEFKYSNFPNLKLKSCGVNFFSKDVHRIKIKAEKILLINNNIYLKFASQMVIITNVKDVKVVEQYLYFTALGNVKIIFDCSEFYRYFNLSIKSEQFNLNSLKQESILDIINNNFDINFSKIAKKYIKIIQKVLKINIFNKKIIIKPNKYKLSFVLTYRLNNRIKRVIVNETI